VKIEKDIPIKKKSRKNTRRNCGFPHGLIDKITDSFSSIIRADSFERSFWDAGPRAENDKSP
jgi:hypothetical protein